MAFSSKGNGTIDSLQKQLSQNISDSLKVETLLALEFIYSEFDPDSAYNYAKSAAVLALRMNNTRNQIRALSSMGWNSYVMGKHAEALNYYFAALTIADKTNNVKEVAAAYGDMGLIYNVIGNNEKSLDYFSKALKLARELKDDNRIGSVLGNMGITLMNMEKLDTALACYSESLEIFRRLDKKSGILINLGTIGLIYEKKKDYDSALIFYEQALFAAYEINHKIEITLNLFNIGMVNIEKNNNYEAEKFLVQALQSSKEMSALPMMRDNNHALCVVYERLSDLPAIGYKEKYDYLHKCLVHYKDYIDLRDSIKNEETQKKEIEAELNYEFEKKQGQERAEHDKKMAIADEQNKKQQLIIWSAFGGVVLIFGFLLFVFRSLRVTQKQKSIIELQKQIVEEKNKEITDSINYARRLQQAILTPETGIKKYFPESFLLYRPKDIVAGDFYFFEATDTHIFYAACDCTGHGVPGAMVSVVCSNALTRCVKEFGLTDPGKILDKTRELILETFQKSGEDVKDGMDISLCTFNFSKAPNFGKGASAMRWAGANNPLWYTENGVMIEIKGDKQPIGKTDQSQPFTTHTAELKKGEWVFLFTDGYADQFGGPKGKKFKYSNLQKLLLKNANGSAGTIKENLQNAFADWKGELEQVDDVCIIGIRI